MINPDTDPTLAASTADPDADFPYGSATNDVAPGDFSGTPLVAVLINDLWGFMQALVTNAGIVPSGSPDNSSDIANGSSQLITAIQYIARNILTLNDGAGNPLINLVTPNALTLGSNGATVTVDAPVQVFKNAQTAADFSNMLLSFGIDGMKLEHHVSPDGGASDIVSMLLRTYFTGGSIAFEGTKSGGDSVNILRLTRESDGHSVRQYFNGVLVCETRPAGIKVKDTTIIEERLISIEATEGVNPVGMSLTVVDNGDTRLEAVVPSGQDFTDAHDLVFKQGWRGGSVRFITQGNSGEIPTINIGGDFDNFDVKMYYDGVLRVRTTTDGFTVVGGITTSTAQCGISDARFKNIRGPVNPADCLANVLTREVTSYAWRDEAIEHLGAQRGERVGFIAQQIGKKEPHRIETREDRKLGKYKVINSEADIPDLTGAVQALHAMIEAQRQEIQELRELINRLV